MPLRGYYPQVHSDLEWYYSSMCPNRSVQKVFASDWTVRKKREKNKEKEEEKHFEETITPKM